ncbi:MAG: PD-(D/E)XK nuclease family protein [Butyrivibrio sp.]|nr:PD-(D/E)XK nuclease family protein [Butyrivibrio sp.]
MLRFCFGASGAGKSTGIYEEIIKRSMEEPGRDFLIIVPDQFTMQTQKDVVRMHPAHAIMNIDILSFGRLSHRIFEETGLSFFSVLDDVGKSLVLMKVADSMPDEIPVIGRNMHKTGYIDEVKSIISEFMQYGIGDNELAVLEEKSKGKKALNAKLRDLRLLYKKFLEFINGRFTTAEETLDILCRALPKSELVRDSVIVFDGFTGFTPIQYRVIKQLLALAKEVIFTVTVGDEADPYSSYEEQELFMLSKKTVRDLERLMFELEKEAGSPVTEFEAFRELRHKEATGTGDIFFAGNPVRRLSANPELSYLESTLFRYKTEKYEGDVKALSIYSASGPREEVRQTMIKIKDLVREEAYAYRDIALVCGSLETYGDLISRLADRYDIPVFVDQSESILLNPFIEYITSAINIVITGYRYEDVFHYLRSGMTGFDRGDVDLLENYVRALGIRKGEQWEERFNRRMPRKFASRKKAASDKEVEILEKLEAMRECITADLEPLFGAGKGRVKDLVDALRSVVEKNDSEKKLLGFRDFFLQKGDLKKAREYEQIYDKVMELFEQMESLIGDDSVNLREFKDILSAGFGEISVGTIPQDVDRIIVGDIERTRLREVRILFFVGVNDGNIPSNAGGGGILSDIDRQFLMDSQSEIEFAPSPRQQMYIQRLYLYMNLTKPTDRLYLSYSEMSQDGKSLNPAYLIPKLLGMYEGLRVERPEDERVFDQIEGPKDGYERLCAMMREYAAGRVVGEDRRLFMTLAWVLAKDGPKELLEKMVDASFAHYKSEPVAKAVALALYGAALENSVSRLELFGSCAYAHFLRYGLLIDERKDFEFDAADLGNVFHKVLEKYTGEIISRGINWKELTKEASDEMLDAALHECVETYGENVLLSSSRNRHMIDRIRRILVRTVDTLKYQMTKGEFDPAFVEMSFDEAGSIDEIDVTLTKDEKQQITERMHLVGKIDRVDLCEDQNHIYVKVMDFKSGAHKFDIAYLYYGLQLQLVMYMNVATAVERKISGGKDVIPAAILYYQVDDPLAEGKEELAPEKINEEIIGKLKMTGLVNGDTDVVRLLDNKIIRSSDIIPVELKKDGSFSAHSQTATLEEYRAISSFVSRRVKEFGKRILSGDISVNPYEDGQKSSCTFCPYRSICGFDERIVGFRKRKLDISANDAKAMILNEYHKFEEQ